MEETAPGETSRRQAQLKEKWKSKLLHPACTDSATPPYGDYAANRIYESIKKSATPRPSCQVTRHPAGGGRRAAGGGRLPRRLLRDPQAAQRAADRTGGTRPRTPTRQTPTRTRPRPRPPPPPRWRAHCRPPAANSPRARGAGARRPGGLSAAARPSGRLRKASGVRPPPGPGSRAPQPRPRLCAGRARGPAGGGQAAASGEAGRADGGGAARVLGLLSASSCLRPAVGWERTRAACKEGVRPAPRRPRACSCPGLCLGSRSEGRRAGGPDLQTPHRPRMGAPGVSPTGGGWVRRPPGAGARSPNRPLAARHWTRSRSEGLTRSRRRRGVNDPPGTTGGSSLGSSISSRTEKWVIYQFHHSSYVYELEFLYKEIWFSDPKVKFILESQGKC
uniref:translation initiation factor IF-2-like n=1 Tax=Nyctereutes procyonoides TaxID=34880 RepID=UPI0024451536|nr:translation initiation factor IF-2-like [Nyctereutes procyonoides]